MHVDLSGEPDWMHVVTQLSGTPTANDPFDMEGARVEASDGFTLRGFVGGLLGLVIFPPAALLGSIQTIMCSIAPAVYSRIFAATSAGSPASGHGDCTNCGAWHANALSATLNRVTAPFHSRGGRLRGIH